jgi:hypothetical protein
MKRRVVEKRGSFALGPHSVLSTDGLPPSRLSRPQESRNCDAKNRICFARNVGILLEPFNETLLVMIPRNCRPLAIWPSGERRRPGSPQLVRFALYAFVVKGLKFLAKKLIYQCYLMPIKQIPWIYAIC